MTKLPQGETPTHPRDISAGDLEVAMAAQNNPDLLGQLVELSRGELLSLHHHLSMGERASRAGTRRISRARYRRGRHPRPSLSCEKGSNSRVRGQQ